MTSNSYLPGNQHFNEANQAEDFMEDWTLPDATPLMINGLIRATLALAHEQHTANLIAFLAWEPSRPVSETDAELQALIVERLGLRQRSMPMQADPGPPPASGDFECCASGSCEVCKR